MITGRVQGVGLRAWIHAEAERRGLKGWVRNRRDGSVEAQFEGEEAAVRAMLAQCQQGPRPAHVEKVSETMVDPSGSPDFEVLATL
jgi:acylphosphatase